MPVVVKAIIPAKYAENSTTVQYTATNVTTIIDKFTATNIGAVTVTLSIYITPKGGTVGNDSLIVETRSLAPGETYIFPEIVGQVLNPGEFVSTIASAASALNIRASGREIS